MDKKDLEAISQIVNSAIEGSNRDLREEIKKSNEDLRKELHKEMNVFEKKILDKMFLFEQDYGKKIDAIFDVAVMQKDKVQEVHKNHEKFRIQVDNLDTKVFELDQRVFKLEHS